LSQKVRDQGHCCDPERSERYCHYDIKQRGLGVYSEIS